MISEAYFLSLFIICLIAFLVPLLIEQLSLFMVPEVIVEIILGIIAGKSCLNIIDVNPWIEFLSLFGFAFLMFLCGMEIDISCLRFSNKDRTGNFNPLKLSIGIFLVTLAVSLLLSVMISNLGIAIHPLLLTLIFSTTSLGIVVPVLKGKRIIHTPFGQVILTSAVVSDLSTMLLVPFIMSIISGDKGSNLTGPLLIICLFLFVYYPWKMYLRPLYRKNPVHISSQLEIKAAFILLLTFVTVSELVNIEIILGAFLAGILFSLLFPRMKIDLLPALDTIGYGFLIPFFFIATGVKFNLSTAISSHSLMLLPLFLFIGFTAKIISHLLLVKYFSLREALGAGFLLSSNLSLTIAVSYIALQAEIITEPIYSTFLLYAILICILSPILFLKITR